jgi:hypothetical protein
LERSTNMRSRPSATAASPAVFRIDDVLDFPPFEALLKNPSRVFATGQREGTQMRDRNCPVE